MTDQDSTFPAKYDSKFPAKRRRPPTADNTAPPGKRTAAPAWFIIGAVVLVIGCFGFYQLSQGKAKPDDNGAIAICRTFVKRQLKSPSTAGFSSERATNDGATWTVTGSVDAENSFGAKLRTAYVCTVRPADATGDNWTLESLTGLD